MTTPAEIIARAICHGAVENEGDSAEPTIGRRVDSLWKGYLTDVSAVITELASAGYAITKATPTTTTRDGLARAICRATIFDAANRPDIEAIVEESWRYNIPDAEAALRRLAERGAP